MTALLNVAFNLAVLPALRPDEHAVTHDVTASLVRPVAAGARVHIAGTILRRGRAIAFLRGEARVDGIVVAAGHVTKSVIAAEADG